MIEQFTDVVPSFFGMLNQGPLTLTIFLHTVIILPMFWIYKQEKAKLNKKQLLGNNQEEKRVEDWGRVLKNMSMS